MSVPKELADAERPRRPSPCHPSGQQNVTTRPLVEVGHPGAARGGRHARGALHAGVPQVSGGYVGVDVFFVICGFLIASLLLRELATTGRLSVRAFYARRALRLLPASSLVIAVTLAGS